MAGPPPAAAGARGPGDPPPFRRAARRGRRPQQATSTPTPAVFGSSSPSSTSLEHLRLGGHRRLPPRTTYHQGGRSHPMAFGPPSFALPSLLQPGARPAHSRTARVAGGGAHAAPQSMSDRNTDDRDRLARVQSIPGSKAEQGKLLATRHRPAPHQPLLPRSFYALRDAQAPSNARSAGRLARELQSPGWFLRSRSPSGRPAISSVPDRRPTIPVRRAAHGVERIAGPLLPGD